MPSGWVYNSADEPIEVTRQDTGLYAVEIPGVSLAKGDLQVNAFALRSVGAVHCVIARLTAGNVMVRCSDADGLRIDSPFVLTYQR